MNNEQQNWLLHRIKAKEIELLALKLEAGTISKIEHDDMLRLVLQEYTPAEIEEDNLILQMAGMK